MAERNLALTPPYQEIAFYATQALADVTSGQMGRYSTDLQAARAQVDREGIGLPPEQKQFSQLSLQRKAPLLLMVRPPLLLVLLLA